MAMAPNPHNVTVAPAADSDDDKISPFYTGNEIPDKISLADLQVVVDTYFQQKCKLAKLDEGGYHKVYEVFEVEDDNRESRSLNAVVRVASPAFPGDKMMSEIATLAYIASHTSVPVPAVYAWNADASNPVGAEWMIMQKIPGIAPFDLWSSTLPIAIKVNVVRQVAQHWAALFALRFEKAGSIYFSPSRRSHLPSTTQAPKHTSQRFEIGPIVSPPFYRELDGEADYPSTDLHSPSSSSFAGLHALRGPFTLAGDFLAHPLRATIFKCERFPRETLAVDEDTEQIEKGDESEKFKALERAKTAIKKGIDLCHIYPGEACIYPPGQGGVASTGGRFTLQLDDFRLTNILIDEKTGTVNGFIDFEGAVTAPLWLAAEVPDWIPDPTTDRASWYGGTRADQILLWETFHSTVDLYDTGGEWRKAYEGGKLFRSWASYVGLGWQVWAGGPGDGQTERWVDKRLSWAREEGHSGVGMPDEKQWWEEEMEATNEERA